MIASDVHLHKWFNTLISIKPVFRTNQTKANQLTNSASERTVNLLLEFHMLISKWMRISCSSMIFTIPLLSHIIDPGPSAITWSANGFVVAYGLNDDRSLSLFLSSSLSLMQFCPHMPRNRECFRVVIHSYWMSDSGSGNEIFAMAFNALIAEIRIVDPDVTECSDRLGAYLAYINACKFTRIIAIIYHILCPQLKLLLWGTSSSCKVGCICIIFE